MRPLRLEMEGFGTFRDRTVVDFSDLELVAFVGPTGSGKSTVIDALTFALYGSVSRYDNPSLVAPVVHQLTVEARVRLDFELGGRRYTAVRVVRRAGSESNRATTREARLEVLESEGAESEGAESEGAEGPATRVLAGNVKELDAEVRRLIGLDFTQFTRTIVLPQGEFARFIRAKAADRQVLLSQLLDLQLYSRMGVRARERAKEAGQRAEMVADRVERLAHATPAAVADVAAELVRLDALEVQAIADLAELDEIERGLVVLRQRVDVLDRALAALAGVAVPADLAPFDRRQAEVRAALEVATGHGVAAWELVVAARAEADAADDPGDVRVRLQQRERLVELESAVRALEAEQGAARAVHREAVELVAEATVGAEAALDALRTTREGAGAAAWIAQLVPGQPCPVCAQVVTTVPDHVTDEAAAAARAEAERCQAALATATSAAARAEGRAESLEAEVAQRTKEAAALSVQLAGVPGVDEVRRALHQATAAGERVREAEAAWREREQAVIDAEGAHRALQQAERNWRRSFTAQRDAVVDLGPPAPSEESLADDWETLRLWAGELAGRRSEERLAVAAEGRELATAKSAVVTRLRAASAAVGLEVAPERLLVAVAERSATARARHAQLQAEQAERAELARTLESVRTERTVHDALGQHLAANRFEGWLLAEALDDIVARANVRLAELSNGRYSLEVVDREFTVRDHGNADERRDIRTLSGGEIFLASLALALALAASIAELAPVDSPRLESIFLDEGFGTLDADTLDVLASAIEELSADGRLVAIVTHVRDLAERMPVRFEVRKGPTTSVIERVEG